MWPERPDMSKPWRNQSGHCQVVTHYGGKPSLPASVKYIFAIHLRHCISTAPVDTVSFHLRRLPAFQGPVRCPGCAGGLQKRAEKQNIAAYRNMTAYRNEAGNHNGPWTMHGKQHITHNPRAGNVMKRLQYGCFVMAPTRARPPMLQLGCGSGDEGREITAGWR